MCKTHAAEGLRTGLPHGFPFQTAHTKREIKHGARFAVLGDGREVHCLEAGPACMRRGEGEEECKGRRASSERVATARRRGAEQGEEEQSKEGALPIAGRRTWRLVAEI